MQTPWGELGDLNLSDHELCRTILASEKHQLVEGLVVEGLFDQIFDDVPAHLEGAVLLDVDTAIVKAGWRDDSWHAFVWVRSRQSGLGRYLAALSNRFHVWLVETDTPLTTFFARPWQDGRFTGVRRPLDSLMAELSGRQPEYVSVTHDVRDAKRQQQSFWGFLSERHKAALGSRVILPRLFMNYGVQPWFRAVWNLDRILVQGDRIWLLEIKHKFPIPTRALGFGINKGELGVIARLAGAGIRCLHTIVVKPLWSPDEGSMYLFNSMQMRARAALIGVDLDQVAISAMLAGGHGSSPGHTTFTGKGKLNYYRLEATSFSRLGVLSDPPSFLAAGIAALVHGTELDPVEDRWLRELEVRS